MFNLRRKPKPNKVSVEVVIAVAWSEDEECYYAWSPQLGCIRDGESEEKAVSMFMEAVEVRLESWIERNTLEENLYQHGYTSNDVKGIKMFARAKGQIFDRSAAQAMTFSDSIILQKVDEITISPGEAVVGVR